MSHVLTGAAPRASVEVLRQERQRLERTTARRTRVGRGWGTLQAEMDAALSTTPTDIPEVLTQLARLQSILDRLPPGPGQHRVASFNSLYRTITGQVQGYSDGGRFADPKFLELLDVEFAKLYFEALRQWGEPRGDAPQSWALLFRHGHDRRLTPRSAAMLGVNAHINHDLPLALVAAWERLGPPASGAPQHPDYLLINEIFFDQIPALRRRFATAWQLEIDRLNGRFDDWSERLVVAATRGLAWEQAQRLWPLRDQPAALAGATEVIDAATALLGQAIVASDSWTRRAWLWLVSLARRAAAALPG